MINFKAIAHHSIQHLQPYQPGKPITELQRELGVTDIIKLASNENPLGASPQAVAAAKTALADIALYPDANGFYLKQTLSQHWQVAPEQITLGNGSDSLFTLICQAYVAPHQHVMMSQYGFISYVIAARTVQAQLQTIPAKHYGHDLAAMAKAITADTRIIFIANPNNPTGTWVNETSLLTLLHHVPEKTLVVLDEAYFEYLDEPDYPDSIKLQQQFPNLIITRTFSKIYGLASLRIGYAISHPDIADILNRIRSPFNVSSPALAAADAAIQDHAFVQQARQVNHAGRQQLTTAFHALGIDYHSSVGNFIMINLQQNAQSVYQKLLAQGIIVRPVANYGLPNHLRITIGLPEQNQRLITALEHII